MRLGTKSLLFGCHQFFLHPLFTIIAWIKLSRLGDRGKLTPLHILAITIHDWGYWGCRTIDGKNGTLHPFLGANIMYRLTKSEWWFEELVCHSRALAKVMGYPASNLSHADKLGIAIMPSWLWASLAWLTGEGWEYLDNTSYSIHKPGTPHTWKSLYQKHVDLRAHILAELRDYFGVEVWG